MSDVDIPSLPGHPTVIHFGAGIVGQLPDALATDARVLVVASDGTRRREAALFDSLGRSHTLDFALAAPAETTLSAISGLVEGSRDLDVDLVLAVGGGAIMDAAKALAIGIRGRDRFEAILDRPDDYADAALPLICVPTTSGSGSDITPYATIWDTDAGCKRSLAHPRLIPQASWIDPALSLSLPAAVTASSGLDALSHAMEAIWNRNHATTSDRLAMQAIRLILQHLSIACEQPANLESRTAMAKAALAGGLAIAITKSAAAHAASYPLTLHHGITHGHACALSLPWLLRWNAAHSPQRAAVIAEAVDMPDAGSAADAIETLIRRTGLPMRLRDLGVQRTDLPRLVETTIASDRIGNTLAKMTTDQVNELFVTIW